MSEQKKAIDMTPEELKEWLRSLTVPEDDEIPCYYFSNPDPYWKHESIPADVPRRNIRFDENGNIVVKNISAYWIPSTFSGLVYCAYCGEKLYYGATNNGKREGAFFDCSFHWKHKDKCGTHFIRESVLERMVLKHIQLVMGYILKYRQHFIFVMEQQLQLESAEKLQTRSRSIPQPVSAA